MKRLESIFKKYSLKLDKKKENFENILEVWSKKRNTKNYEIAKKLFDELQS